MNRLLSKCLISRARDGHRKTISNHTLSDTRGNLPLRTHEDQKVRLYVTVDFEESFDWSSVRDPITSVGDLDGVAQFHRKCFAKGIKPTYFATYNILSDKRSVDFLRRARRDGECDVGIHPHAWATPPVREDSNEFNTFQGNLPMALEAEKLRTLADAFLQGFETFPEMHRAGKYGVTAQTHDLLETMGIFLDFSPSSGFDFGQYGGPDFRDLQNMPFWTGPHRKVLCLPVPCRYFLRGPDTLSRLFGEKLSRTFGVPVRLSPEGNTIMRMQMIADHVLKAGGRDIIVTTHSTSLWEGGNPYSRTTANVKALIERLVAFVDWMSADHGAECCLPTTELRGIAY